MGRNRWSFDNYPDSWKLGGKKKIKIHVRARSTVRVWFTHNGSEIKNADGSSLSYFYQSTISSGIDSAIDFPFSKLNGKSVTDMKYATIRPQSTNALCCAAFEDGEMKPLGEWLLAHGYAPVQVGLALVQAYLTLPVFAAKQASINIGVSLDVLDALDRTFLPQDVGARFLVEQGRITRSIDAKGLKASDFESLYFGSDEIVAGKDGWTSADPYDGEVMLVALDGIASSEAPEREEMEKQLRENRLKRN